MKSLSELSERFNVALKNAPVSVYMLDRDMRFTWVYNPPFHFTEQEMLGKRDDELHPLSEVSELISLKRKVLDTGIGTHKELRLKLQGKVGIYDITIEPLRNIEGELVGLTVAWIDVTGYRRLEAEMRERAAQIEIQRQILRHRELERMEIARDLHDGPLQEMIGMNFAISELTLIDDPNERLATLEKLHESLQHQIQNVRAFCYELRPPALTPFGLERAIRSHIENLARNDNSIIFHLDLAHDGQALLEEIRLALFRVFQEALNNIQRHARADQVWIHFSYDEEQIKLEIRDNGQGFKVPFQWLDLAREGHLGLVGMHERVQAINGQVFIESEPEHGTIIRVIVPRSGM
jgi:signal transduction histidine kinase